MWLWLSTVEHGNPRQSVLYIFSTDMKRYGFRWKKNKSNDMIISVISNVSSTKRLKVAMSSWIKLLGKRKFKIIYEKTLYIWTHTHAYIEREWDTQKSLFTILRGFLCLLLYSWDEISFSPSSFHPFSRSGEESPHVLVYLGLFSLFYQQQHQEVLAHLF